MHTIQVLEGWDEQGGFLAHVFTATRFAGELTDTEPGKHLDVTWIPADPAELLLPLFPTVHTALPAYLGGSTGFSTHGWDDGVDPRALVTTRP